MEILNLYYQYQGELWTFVLGLVVFGFMFALKAPIKMLTDKLGTEKYRKLANKSIIFLTLGFGILAQYVYSVITHSAFDATVGLKIGGVAITTYATIEGLNNKKLQKEIIEDGKEIAKDIGEIISDGKITKEEIQTIGKSAVERLEDIIGK